MELLVSVILLFASVSYFLPFPSYFHRVHGFSMTNASYKIVILQTVYLVMILLVSLCVKSDQLNGVLNWRSDCAKFMHAHGGFTWSCTTQFLPSASCHWLVGSVQTNYLRFECKSSANCHGCNHVT